MARIFILSSEAPALAGVLRALDQHSNSGFRIDDPWWNPAQLLAAHRAIRDAAPDGLHCIGFPAFRAAALLNRKRLPFVYSDVVPDRLDRLTRRHAARGTALVHTEREREQFQRLGLRAETVPLGVQAPARSHPDSNDESKVILFGGSLDAASAPLQAAWAFDVLKYAIPGAELVFLGDGPMLRPVRELSYALGFDDYRVRFEPEAAREEWFARANVAWLTQPEGGALPALNALAHGLPVIAMRTPQLDEYACEGLTLVPAGDRVALASATLKQLNGPRAVVPAPRFPYGAMVERYAAVYDAMAGVAA